MCARLSLCGVFRFLRAQDEVQKHFDMLLAHHVPHSLYGPRREDQFLNLAGFVETGPSRSAARMPPGQVTVCVWRCFVRHLLPFCVRGKCTSRCIVFFRPSVIFIRAGVACLAQAYLTPHTSFHTIWICRKWQRGLVSLSAWL